MSKHDETLMKYYGKIVYPEGKLCVSCNQMKQHFDYSSGYCNECYIKLTER